MHQKSISKGLLFFDNRNYVEQSTSKLSWFFVHQNYVEESAPKLCQTMYVKATSTFWPLALRHGKYVDTRSVFHPAKLHQKRTSKWGGNLSISCSQCINIISTSNRCSFKNISATFSSGNLRSKYNKIYI